MMISHVFWYSLVDVKTDSSLTGGAGKYCNIQTSCGSYLLNIHCEKGVCIMPELSTFLFQGRNIN